MTRPFVASFAALAVAMALPAAADDAVTWNTLRSPEATASSYLVSNWNRFSENYHPTYVLDDNPRTAWVEGVDGNGEGQSITLPLSAVRSARAVRVRVRNGYQKTAGLLRANAAPADVRLRVLDGGGREVAAVDAHLEREMGWQDIVIPVGGGAVSAVQLEIVTVHEGSRYRDTCISDIEVGVDSDSTYDAAAEDRRLGAARAWIGERVAAARYFADQPAEYPFAHTQFSSKPMPPQESEIEQAMAAERARIEVLAQTPSWFNVSHTKRLEAVPEGTYEFDDVLQHFQPANLAWFETDADLSAYTEQEYDPDQEIYWQGEEWRYNDKVRFSDATSTRPAEVLTRLRRIIHERGTYETDRSYLVTYGDDGRVQSLFVANTGVSDFDLPHKSEQLFRFRHDEAGKITGYSHWQRQEGPDWDRPTYEETAAAPPVVSYTANQFGPAGA